MIGNCALGKIMNRVQLASNYIFFPYNYENYKNKIIGGFGHASRNP